MLHHPLKPVHNRYTALVRVDGFQYFVSMCNEMVTSEIRLGNNFTHDLFKHGGVKALEYFIQVLKKNHFIFFSKLFSSHHFLKSLNQLTVLFRVFKFSAACFNSV